MNKTLILLFFVITGLTKLAEFDNTIVLNSYSVSDSIYPKNLKALSEFADTSVINRYSKEIKDFLKMDSVDATKKKDAVFTGSSSIRKWKTLADDMKNCKVLNRGFGGSTIPEVIYYANELVFKHNPSKIVLYAGENDVADNKSSTKKVVSSFIYFQRLANLQLPESHVYFISAKPSPSRWKLWPQIKLINQKIKQYCDTTLNCTFVDVSSAMLNEKGELKKEIFAVDGLHLNENGYKIWTKVIGKALKCEINKRL